MRSNTLLAPPPPSQSHGPRVDRGKLLVAATSLCVLLFCAAILEGEATGERKSWLFYVSARCVCMRRVLWEGRVGDVCVGCCAIACVWLRGDGRCAVESWGCVDHCT